MRGMEKTTLQRREDIYVPTEKQLVRRIFFSRNKGSTRLRNGRIAESVGRRRSQMFLI
jgi:hypothetical protein